MAGQSELRLMLVDGHPLFREGLCSILQQTPGYRVVAEADTWQEAIAQLARVQPDLVVADFGVQDHACFAPIREFLAVCPEIPILVMSVVSSKYDVLDAIEAGARGYISKEAGREEVLCALREVCSGRSYLDPQVAHVVFERVRHPGLEAQGVYLTGRETELLEHLGRGNKPQQIADTLHLSPSTVKTHIRSLFRKFGVNSRTQLVLKAIQRGLIQLAT